MNRLETLAHLAATRRAAQVRTLEPSELRRLRERYSDGMPVTALAKLHRLSPLTVKELVADIEREKPTKLLRQAAHVARDL